MSGIFQFSSGLEVNQDVAAQFKSAGEDASVSFLVVGIVHASFKALGTGKTTGDRAKDFSSIQPLLAQEPVYVFLKSGDRWLTIAYSPAEASAQLRMGAAVSLAALKRGLGNSQFLQWDYHILRPEECTLAQCEGYLADIHSRGVLTAQEQNALAGYNNVSEAMCELRVPAFSSPVNIAVSAEAIAAMKAVAGGASPTAVFSLSEGAVLAGAASGLSLNEVALQLPDAEARYVVHRFAHTHDARPTAVDVFLLYAPQKDAERLDNASAHRRMLAAAAQHAVLYVLSEHGIVNPAKFEFAEAAEVSSAAILDELYPSQEARKRLKKKLWKGRGKPSKAVRKFQAP